MTTGVLIFAYNNEHIDYLAMADWSAKNIRRHLRLPVAVVTNELPPDEYKFEQIILAKATGSHTRKFTDLPETVTWYNGNRADAYTLSPWSQTLVLDADYVVASNQLKVLLNIDQDFVAHQTAYDVTDDPMFAENNYFGRNRMPMSWATVMMFRRSKHAKMIFDCMTMIKQNWDHYRGLYGVNKGTYRNDYALSIALNITSGHTLTYPTIPWSLASVDHSHTVTQLDQDRYRVEYIRDNKPRYITLAQDFHAMGKGYLGAIVANNSSERIPHPCRQYRSYRLCSLCSPAS
jgi:hypothetical protein